MVASAICLNLMVKKDHIFEVLTLLSAKMCLNIFQFAEVFKTANIAERIDLLEKEG